MMLQPDFQTMPGHLLRRAQQLSNALFAEECGAFDLTAVQYAALHALADHDDLDATRLASLIAFDRSTIGDVLERLAAKGWITRQALPGDRRVKLLKLAPAGRKILHEVKDHVAIVQQRIVAPLNASERAQFIALLGKIVGQGTHAAAMRETG